MTDVLRLESLRKTYDGPVTALDRVTIGFAAGSFTAVMGPSGPGKSTLLQCAAGPDRPALTVEQNVVLPPRPAGRRADGKRVQAVLAHLRSVVDQYGRTVVMVTHDPAAASYADTAVSRGSMS